MKLPYPVFPAPLLAALVCFSACRPTPDEAGKVNESVVVPAPPEFPATPAGQAIRTHFAVFLAAGPDAEARYRASLESLRRSAPEVASLLYAAYRRAGAGNYPFRWAAVATLADLRADTALRPLAAIAREPLPPPMQRQVEALDPREEEIILRTTAVSGLGRLAATNDSAVEALRPFLRHDVPPIREEALAALALAAQETPDTLRRARLQAFLPRDYVPSRPDDRPVPPQGARASLTPRERHNPAPPRVTRPR